MTTGFLKLLLRSFTGPVIVTSLLSVVFHLVLNQVPGSLQISKKFFLTIFPGGAHLCSSYHHWLASRGSSSGFPTFQQGCHRLSGKEIWEYSDGVRRYNPGFSFSPLYQKCIFPQNNCNIFYINGQMGLLKGP